MNSREEQWSYRVLGDLIARHMAARAVLILNVSGHGSSNDYI